MSDLTPVLFRTTRSGEFAGIVTAVFPTIAEDRGGQVVSCYEHIGQHGGCSLEWMREKTRPATPQEYAALKAELEAAPFSYRFKVCQRITPAMRAERMQRAA